MVMFAAFVVWFISLVSVAALRGNDTEILAYEALQVFPSLKNLHHLLTSEIMKEVKVKAYPSLFEQQMGVEPEDGKYQLNNFGATQSWESIHNILKSSRNNRLLIMVRHGQAWENLNPTSNKNCEFQYNGETIQNFDSPLSPLGHDQTKELNELLSSNVNQSSSATWFESLGLTDKSTTFITSPLTRTMQTTQGVFSGLPIPSDNGNDGRFAVHELIRASAAGDVCNFRHNVFTPTTSLVLPAPWQTGCAVIPDDYLAKTYSDENSVVKFQFNIRPAGGEGFGIISDNDQLWRADVSESDETIIARAKAFLAQVFDYTPESSVTVVVTHGEMVSAIYQAAGEQSYGPKNTEVVPLLLTYA